MIDSQIPALFESLWLERTKIDSLTRQEVYWNFRNFYVNDYEAIETFVKAFLRKKQLYSEDTLRKIPFRHVNYIRKVISRLTAGIIDNLPIVRLKLDNEERAREESAKFSNVLIEANYWTKVRDAFKKTVFFNLSEMYPKWNNGLTFEVLTPEMYVVVQDESNYLEKSKIVIQKSRIVNNQPELYYVVWTASEHYEIDIHGNRKEIDGNPAQTNPFGVIPCIKLQFETAQDYYGIPNWDLFNFQLMSDIQRTNKFFQEIFQTNGVWVAVNMNMQDKSSIKPGDVIDINNAKNDEVQPSLTFANPNINWNALIENIEYDIKDINRSQGLSGASLDLERIAQSGVSKTVDEMEIEEIRNGFKEPLYDWIIQTLEVARQIYNYNTKEASKRIDEKAEIEVVFSEEKAVESVEDKLKRRTMEKQFFIKTELDFIQEDFEVNEIEAQEIYEKNRAFGSGAGVNIEDILGD